ncbi:helix-hairpin-helix domain-containing protein [Emticicia oligotrophica]|nr:helix-hairpin-helix domain-containing protein [Emticicia oligotrophica]
MILLFAVTKKIFQKIALKCPRVGLQTLLILLSIQEISAQNKPRSEINLDAFIQRVFPVQQENINYEDLYESLYQLYQNPLNLNTATAEELASIYILSQAQINSIVQHREQNGDFLSIYELQAVQNLDLETISKILPFVEVRYKFSAGDLRNRLTNPTEHYLVLRNSQTLEQSKGFAEDKYLGSPQHLYARYRLSHPKDFQVGFIVEKDAGEKHYLDFYTFHFQLKNKGNLRNLILGDYQAQFGQGLIMSAGFSLGKSSEAIATTRRSNLGLRPYGSLLEGGYFRGAAATYQIDKIDLTGFYSYAKRDANINETDGEREDYFSSVLTGGLHRTATELARKNQLTEQSFGLNATFRFKNGQVGATILNTQFDAFLQRTPVLYNKFEFVGKQNLVAGTNATYTWQNFNFFGEAARSSSGGVGAIGGFVAALSKQVEWAVNLRNFDRNFHSFYANALSEGSRNINERGIYWGLKYTPKKGLVFSGFYDRFQFPWLRYLVDAPSSGFDYLLRMSYQINKKALFYAQYHEEHKGKNLPNNTTVSDLVVNTIRQSILVNFEYAINRDFKTQTRVQLNTFQYETRSKSKGYVLMQDIEGTIRKVQLKGRIAYYSTDDYDSRIYVYENDVLYAISFPAYYGNGLRTYLIARYGLTKNLDLWVRYARTQLSGVTSIGSGNDQINAPHRSEIKAQIKYSF